MKRILFSVAVFFFALAGKTDPVFFSSAKNIAMQFCDFDNEPTLVKKSGANRIAAKSSNAELLQDYYVFSRGLNKGFVIVSGNDALPQILGYTDSGDFDYDNMPPALQDMLICYSEMAQYADSVDASNEAKGIKSVAKAPRKASGTRDVATLMTSHHHQSWPYNNLVPCLKSNGNRAATGCVATAASQIIYYWRKDMNDRTKYTTPTYGYGDAPATADYQIPSGTPLKWNLMQDSYGGSDPAECTNAIATLVATVGMSAWLTYGSSTSGQIDNCRNVFSGQFELNGGTTVWRGSNQTSWEKMIISDLELGRPILYSGVHPSNGGHAVVIDGYQLKTNLFHFNFGWGAGNGYDGYYTVDDAGMNGFSGSQGMVYMIYPKKANISGKINMSENKLISRVKNTITAKVTNNATLPQSNFYLYCISGTSLPSSSVKASDKDESTVIPSGSSATLTFTFTPSSTNEYTIYLCDENYNILDKVSNVESVASVPDLTLNSLTIDDGGVSEDMTIDGKTVNVKHIFNTKKANVTANFTNGSNGTLCSPSVKGLYYKYDASTGKFGTESTKTKKNVIFGTGSTENVVFDLTGLTDNSVYKFKLSESVSTNKSFDINFATSDSVVYFKLVGANLTAEKSEDSNEMIVKGNFNPLVFETLTGDETISRYDMTQVSGIKTPLSASNKNALFYVTTEQDVNGRNIVSGNVCDELDLTPGYNFAPSSDFKALKATYHANQAVGKFATAIVPFDAEVPSGMFARKVNEVKGSYLQQVDSCNLTIAGGTPYIILSGKEVDIEANNVEVSINTPSLATDTVKGTWVNVVAEGNQYVLDDADLQYFNTCTGTVIPALTAYLDYTKKVRSTSVDYNTKDKKAKQLAQQIAASYETLAQYADVCTETSQATLLAVIETACDSLRTQPVLSLQSEQIKYLESAVEEYVASASVVSDNGLVDKSSYILNPSFELGTIKNWTSAGTVKTEKITTSRSTYMSGADGIVVAKLNAGSSLTQSLSGVENGVYQLVASVASDYDKSVSITVKTAADTYTETATTTDFGPMYFSDVVVDEIEVSDHTMQITVSASDDSWAKADNFRLYQIRSNEIETGIISVDVNSSSSKTTSFNSVYDLSGRRVSESYIHKGIYIKNGNKIIK